VTARQIWDRLIPSLDPRLILEIGSFEGASACYLIERCGSRHALEIHCVDTWEGGIEHNSAGIDMASVSERFRQNTKLGVERAKFPVKLVEHRGPSARMLPALITAGYADRFDLVYIDGSHRAPDVLSDAVLSFQLLKVGGTLIFDDYLYADTSHDLLDAPKLAVDAFMNIYSRHMRLIYSENSQVLARKTSF
jgi:predicted O-methyltransferase YrrM